MFVNPPNMCLSVCTRPSCLGFVCPPQAPGMMWALGARSLDLLQNPLGSSELTPNSRVSAPQCFNWPATPCRVGLHLLIVLLRLEAPEALARPALLVVSPHRRVSHRPLVAVCIPAKTAGNFEEEDLLFTRPGKFKAHPRATSEVCGREREEAWPRGSAFISPQGHSLGFRRYTVLSSSKRKSGN